MSDLDDINSAITQNAVDGIKKQKVGNEETEAVSIADLIAAAKHVGANAQAASASRVIFNKISPPGAS